MVATSRRGYKDRILSCCTLMAKSAPSFLRRASLTVLKVPVPSTLPIWYLSSSSVPSFTSAIPSVIHEASSLNR